MAEPGPNISYSDGEEVEREVLSLIRQARNRSSMDWIGKARHEHETIKYHLAADRASLLRPFQFEGLDVLELGAGMGAISRYLVENARSVTSVEGTRARFEALKERVAGFDNWKGVVSNIQDFSTEERFDAVVVVGVMEYSELYIDQTQPFEFFMKHAGSFLREGGVLILAIENQSGIKYWAGAPEDHTRSMYDGICGYSVEKSVRTFDRLSLRRLFEDAGLTHVEEFYPWPDYKHVSTVVSQHLVAKDSHLAGELAADALLREPDLGIRFFPEALAMQTVANQGRYAEFSNSLLFLGTADGRSKTLETLLERINRRGELAWHYALERKSPILTVIRESSGRLESSKTKLQGEDPVKVRWSDPGSEEVLASPRVSSLLARHAFFGETEQHDRLLDSFLGWSFEVWSDGRWGLSGDALDAIATNAVVEGDGFRTFDLEWHWPGAISRSWFVLRNVWALRHGLGMFPDLPYASVRDAYEKVCLRLAVEPNFAADRDNKIMLHHEVSYDQQYEAVVANFHRWLEQPIVTTRYARNYRLELQLRMVGLSASEQKLALRTELDRLQEENHHLRAELSRKAVRLALATDRAARKVPFAHAMGRAIVRLLRPRR